MNFIFVLLPVIKSNVEGDTPLVCKPLFSSELLIAEAKLLALF